MSVFFFQKFFPRALFRTCDFRRLAGPLENESHENRKEYKSAKTPIVENCTLRTSDRATPVGAGVPHRFPLLISSTGAYLRGAVTGAPCRAVTRVSDDHVYSRGRIRHGVRWHVRVQRRRGRGRCGRGRVLRVQQAQQVSGLGTRETRCCRRGHSVVGGGERRGRSW